MGLADKKFKAQQAFTNKLAELEPDDYQIGLDLADETLANVTAEQARREQYANFKRNMTLNARNPYATPDLTGLTSEGLLARGMSINKQLHGLQRAIENGQRADEFEQRRQLSLMQQDIIDAELDKNRAKLNTTRRELANHFTRQLGVNRLENAAGVFTEDYVPTDDAHDFTTMGTIKSQALEWGGDALKGIGGAVKGLGDVVDTAGYMLDGVLPTHTQDDGLSLSQRWNKNWKKAQADDGLLMSGVTDGLNYMGNKALKASKDINAQSLNTVESLRRQWDRDNYSVWDMAKTIGGMAAESLTHPEVLTTMATGGLGKGIQLGVAGINALTKATNMDIDKREALARMQGLSDKDVYKDKVGIDDILEQAPAALAYTGLNYIEASALLKGMSKSMPKGLYNADLKEVADYLTKSLPEEDMLRIAKNGFTPSEGGIISKMMPTFSKTASEEAKDLTAKEVLKYALGGIAKQGAKTAGYLGGRAAVGALGEAPIEYLQTKLELSTRPDLTAVEKEEQARDAAIAGGLVGGSIGASTHIPATAINTGKSIYTKAKDIYTRTNDKEVNTDLANASSEPIDNQELDKALDIISRASTPSETPTTKEFMGEIGGALSYIGQTENFSKLPKEVQNTVKNIGPIIQEHFARKKENPDYNVVESMTPLESTLAALRMQQPEIIESMLKGQELQSPNNNSSRAKEIENNYNTLMSAYNDIQNSPNAFSPEEYKAVTSLATSIKDNLANGKEGYHDISKDIFIEGFTDKYGKERPSLTNYLAKAMSSRTSKEDLSKMSENISSFKKSQENKAKLYEYASKYPITDGSVYTFRIPKQASADTPVEVIKGAIDREDDKHEGYHTWVKRPNEKANNILTKQLAELRNEIDTIDTISSLVAYKTKSKQDVSKKETTEPKPETKAENTQPKVEPKPTPKPEVKSTPKQEAKPEPTQEKVQEPKPKVEPKPEQVSQPSTKPTLDTVSAPKPIEKTSPKKSEPKPLESIEVDSKPVMDTLLDQEANIPEEHKTKVMQLNDHFKPSEKANGILVKDPKTAVNNIRDFLGASVYTQLDMTLLKGVGLTDEKGNLVSVLPDSKNGDKKAPASLLLNDNRVRASLMYRGLEWLITGPMNYTADYMDTLDTISKMGFPEEAINDQFIKTAMTHTFASTALPAIGRKVLKDIGFSVNKETTSSEELSLIEQELGLYAVRALIKNDLVKETSLEIDSKSGTKVNFYGLGNVNYRKFLKLDGDTDLYKKMNNLSLALKDSEAEVSSYMTEKPEVDDSPYTFIKGKGNTKISTIHKKALNVIKTTPYMPIDREAITEIINDESYVKALKKGMGYIELDETTTDPNSPKYILPSDLDSVKGKNREIEQSIESMKNYINSEDSTAPIYFDSFMSKNNRFFMRSTNINPQATKFHRFLVTPVDAKDTYEIKNGEVTTPAFYISIAQAFGFKTDKKATKSSIDFGKAIVEKFAESDPKDYLKFIKALISDGKEHKIAGKTIEIEEVSHTIQAALAIRDLVNARNSGKDSFETTITTEIDGINNGLILKLNQYMLSPDYVDNLAAGGVSYGTNTSERINDKYDKGFLDLYQRFAKNIGEYLEAGKANTSEAINNAHKFLRLNPSKKSSATLSRLIENLSGKISQEVSHTFELDEGKVSSKARKAAKPISQVFSYGAGEKASILNLSRYFTEGLPKLAYAYAKRNDPAGKQAYEILTNIVNLDKNNLDIEKVKKPMEEYLNSDQGILAKEIWLDDVTDSDGTTSKKKKYTVGQLLDALYFSVLNEPAIATLEATYPFVRQMNEAINQGVNARINDVATQIEAAKTIRKEELNTDTLTIAEEEAIEKEVLKKHPLPYTSYLADDSVGNAKSSIFDKVDKTNDNYKRQVTMQRLKTEMTDSKFKWIAKTINGKYSMFTDVGAASNVLIIHGVDGTHVGIVIVVIDKSGIHVIPVHDALVISAKKAQEVNKIYNENASVDLENRNLVRELASQIKDVATTIDMEKNDLTFNDFVISSEINRTILKHASVVYDNLQNGIEGSEYTLTGTLNDPKELKRLLITPTMTKTKGVDIIDSVIAKLKKDSQRDLIEDLKELKHELIKSQTSLDFEEKDRTEYAEKIFTDLYSGMATSKEEAKQFLSEINKLRELGIPSNIPNNPRFKEEAEAFNKLETILVGDYIRSGNISMPVLQEAVNKINSILTEEAKKQSGERSASGVADRFTAFNDYINEVKLASPVLKQVLHYLEHTEDVSLDIVQGQIRSILDSQVIDKSLHSPNNSNENTDSTLTEEFTYDGNPETLLSKQAEMRSIDKLDGLYDENHSKQLQDVFKQVINASKESLKDLKVRIEEAKGKLHEGSFDPYARVSKIVRASTPTRSGMSLEETYTHEVLHASLEYGLRTAGLNSREGQYLKEIHSQAIKYLEVEDFLPKVSTGDVNEDMKIAKKMYKHFTTSSSSEAYLNSLNEFMVMGITDKTLVEKLKSIPYEHRRKESKATNLFERMVEVVQDFISFAFNKTFKGAKSGSLYDALLALDLKLANANAKVVQARAKQMTMVRALYDAAFEKANDKIKASFNAFIDWAKKNNMTIKVNEYPKSYLDSLTNMVKLQVEAAIHPEKREVLQSFMHKIQVARYGGWLHTLWQDFTKADKLGRTIEGYIYTANRIDADALATKTVTEKTLANLFSKPLDDIEAKNLGIALIDTDMGYLVKKYSLDEVSKYLKDKDKIRDRQAKIRQEIIDLAKGDEALSKVKPEEYYNFIEAQASGLATYMATNQADQDGQLLNAENIAKMLGSSKAITQSNKEIVDLIDELVSLKAIDRLPKKSKELVIDKIANEKSAMQGLFSFLETQNEIARKKLFNGSEFNIIKGYRSEVYNADTDVVIARVDEADRLKTEGYKLVANITTKDDADTFSAPRAFYVNEWVSNAPKWNKAAVKLTSLQSRGHTLNDLYVQDITSGNGVSNEQFLATLKAVEQKHRANADAMFKRTQRVVNEQPSLVPTLDATGHFDQFRYTMNKGVKSEIVGMDTNIFKSLAQYASTTQDKIATIKHNEEVATSLYNYYIDHASEVNPFKIPFVELSKHSKDERIQEIYRLLPKPFLDKLEEKFADRPIMIRADMLNWVFGFRDIDIKKTKAFSSLSSGQLKRIALMADTLVKKATKIAKSNVVAKNTKTITSNIISNFNLILMQGGNPKQMWDDHVEGVNLLEEYRKNVYRLKELQTLEKSGKRVNKAEIENIKRRLNDSPIKEMIQKGLFTSIVEDISMEDSKDAIDEKIDAIKAKLPYPVRTALETMFITKETTMYQTLAKILSASDFVARYALKKELERQGLPKDEIYNRIIDSFINYDIPMSPARKALEERGFLMFSKFFTRIQKVLTSDILKEKPAQALFGILLNSKAGLDLETPFDSSVIEKNYDVLFSNPITQLGNAMTPASFQYFK